MVVCQTIGYACVFWFLVGESSFPFLFSCLSGGFFLCLVVFFQQGFHMGFLVLAFGVLSFLAWELEVSLESVGGFHGEGVFDSFKSAFLFLIFSEVLFFAAFFGSYFYSSFSFETSSFGLFFGGLVLSSPFSLPLLNTVLLLGSSATLTVSHHSFSLGEGFLVFLVWTYLLGFLFLEIQLVEYKSVLVSISDSSFGSVFFISTGFHMFHVVVGLLFLLVVGWFLSLGFPSSDSHLGFDSGVYYWHFVDVVWLFLFLNLYLMPTF